MQLTYFIERLLGFDFAGYRCGYAIAHPWWVIENPDDLISLRPIYIPKPTRKTWYDPHGSKLWEYWKARCLNYWLRAMRRQLARKHMFV